MRYMCVHTNCVSLSEYKLYPSPIFNFDFYIYLCGNIAVKSLPTYLVLYVQNVPFNKYVCVISLSVTIEEMKCEVYD